MKPKLDYELNHIYHRICQSPAVSIADDDVLEVEHIEFFAKSLALTSDLKRLPVIRGLSIDKQTAKAILSHMVASQITHLKFVLTIWNEELTQPELDAILTSEETIEAHKLIYSATVEMFYNAVAPVYIHVVDSIPTWDYEGGILGANKITLGKRVLTYGPVASSALPAAELEMLVFLEVDWIAVSKDEFEDYILEHVYAEG